jgi:hypothetical protein
MLRLIRWSRLREHPSTPHVTSPVDGERRRPLSSRVARGGKGTWKMTSLPGKVEEHNDHSLPLADLLTDLSILLAMQYRRAPLPIAPSMVRWFAGRSIDQVVDEAGSVVRRCLLLGDETLVLRELKRHRFATQLALALPPRVTEAACCLGTDGAPRRQGAKNEELPSMERAEPSSRLLNTRVIPPVESSTSHKREGLNCESQ